MEEKSIQLRSIWGKWWQPIRKWFYSIWLAYETIIRFYDYAISVNVWFINHDPISESIGETGTLFLGAFCSVLTLVICTIFLTVPACFLLYKFFDTANLTDSKFETKMKPIF